MVVVGRKKLETFKRKHTDAKGPLDAWLNEALNATWLMPAGV